jgi:IS4 transposase
MCFVDQAILDKAGTVTKHVSHVVFPAFSLNRGEGCEIPENAYWGLQTYLGLRENLAANEGARSFIHESPRERTPLGHGHREQIRDLSIEQIREMYRRWSARNTRHRSSPAAARRVEALLVRHSVWGPSLFRDSTEILGRNQR